MPITRAEHNRAEQLMSADCPRALWVALHARARSRTAAYRRAVALAGEDRCPLKGDRNSAHICFKAFKIRSSA